MATMAGSSSTQWIQASIEAAAGNRTLLYNDIAPGWVDAPHFRGTMNILTTCVFTLVACVYTALHLNVPETSGVWPALLAKLKWLMLTIFAPEILVFSAAQQFVEARALALELTRLQRESSTADKKFDFNITYGFLVLLGGLAVSVEDIAPSLYERLDRDKPPAKKYVRRLSAAMVLTLANLDVFLYISQEQIEDKSKSSIVGKTLVLVQVWWFVTQCVVRRAYDLPLSLLEIHTIVHVVCALIMYLMWWKKPHNIGVPEMIDQRPIEDLVALMVHESHDRGSLMASLSLVVYEDVVTSFQIKVSREEGEHANEVTWEFVKGNGRNLPTTVFDPSTSSSLQPGQVLGCGIGLAVEVKPYGKVKPLDMSPKDLTRYTRVREAIRRLDPRPPPGIQPYMVPNPQRSPVYWARYPAFSEAFQTDFPNLELFSAGQTWRTRQWGLSAGAWYLWFGMRRGPSLQTVTGVWKNVPLFPILTMLTILYGGVHLLAWNAHFPSQIEALIWKISCFAPMSVIPILATSDRLEARDPFWFFDFRETHLWRKLVYYLLWGISVVACFLGVACRVFLVAESFVSLRSVPIGVYWTPAWLQMIPHI